MTTANKQAGTIESDKSYSTLRSDQRDWRFRRMDLEKYLLWIVLGIGAIAMIGPFYWMFISSFKTRQEAVAIPPTWFPQDPTLENWIAIMNLPLGSLPTFFKNSLFVVSTITLVTLFTSSIAGYVFAKFEFRYKKLIFGMVLSMLVVPFSVTLIPLFNLVADWGWRNSYAALIVPILFTPFGIFLMRQQISQIPSELIDAARIDGSSEFGIYWRIILPLSGASLAALAIFTFTYQWDNFLWPLVVLDRPDLYTIPLGLAQFRGRATVDIGLVSAVSFISVLPILIVYVFAQKRFIEGITLSGMK